MKTDDLERLIALNRKEPGVDELAARRIWRRLQQRHIGKPRARLWPRMAIVCALIFVSGGTVGAAVMAFYVKARWHAQASPINAPAPLAASFRRTRAERSVQPTVNIASTADTTKANGVVPRSIHRKKAPEHRGFATSVAETPVATVPEPPSEPTPAGDDEADSLANILRQLRRGVPASEALPLIEQHRRQWPNGRFAHEVDIAHLEALLSASRHNEALTWLQSHDLTEGLRGAELRLIKAELLAKRGDCTNAMPEFERIASSGGGSTRTLAPRALLGLATCKATLGDPTGAQRDLAFRAKMLQTP